VKQNIPNTGDKVDPQTIDRGSKGRRLREPLSMNNWQMGRTPKLVVNDAQPNIYMTLAGMG